MTHLKRRSALIILAVMFTVACACPFSLPNLNPMAGAQGTVAALASQMPEGALSTIQAAATMLPEGSVETLMAVAPTVIAVAPTYMSEEALQTVQAELGNLSSTEQVPADIPLPDGEKTILIANEKQVHYQINQTLKELIAFHQEKMPANGWAFVKAGSSESDENATLIYKKGNRKATVTISDLKVTRLVMIEIVSN